ncbi:hypothetical protein SAMN05444682_10852 [Parapedobacter indicus]|uniref:Uncharacterized protein n=1 Tax=Parapedobacter indicus TaxID=1477437 RepID=A0A1I3PJ29_9SPHI|nr:hypothetical protein CLV26_10852 [Parapedobacter indicus]SFJ21046.1 hypothetical protein SAMN05444682_10852 [Parapedobacter indicus]
MKERVQPINHMKKINLLLFPLLCLFSCLNYVIAQEGRSGYFNNTKVGFIDVLSADYGGAFLMRGHSA